MKFADLASLFQLGVGLNLGFGAISIFAEPVRKELRSTIGSIEARLAQLNRAQGRPGASEAEIERAFDLNRTYLRLIGASPFLRVETRLWQSLAARFAFMLCSFGCLFGLIRCAYAADESAPLAYFVFAIVFNAFPMVVALVFFGAWWWCEHSFVPRVERLAEHILSSDQSGSWA